MRYTILVAASLFLAFPVQAQEEEDCTKWWCRWGLPRDTVDVRVNTMRSNYDVDIPVNTEERVCVKWDLVENETCYSFDEEGLSVYTSTSYNQSAQDIGKELARARRTWGNPIGYYADFTQVSSWEEAVALADPRAEMHFIDEEIGTVYQFVFNTEGGRYSKEGAFTQVEIYKRAEDY